MASLRFGFDMDGTGQERRLQDHIAPDPDANEIARPEEGAPEEGAPEAEATDAPDAWPYAVDLQYLGGERTIHVLMSGPAHEAIESRGLDADEMVRRFVRGHILETQQIPEEGHDPLRLELDHLDALADDAEAAG